MANFNEESRNMPRYLTRLKHFDIDIINKLRANLKSRDAVTFVL